MKQQKRMMTHAGIYSVMQRINGADIYYEIRGSGPAVMLIQGAGGDAGTFEKSADNLSDEFTIVTYDRRGNSRSPIPGGWQKTTISEQADDAAALIESLDITPAIVFGTSGAALILLQIILSHPRVLRRAIVHEPAMFANMPGGDEIGAQIKTFMEQGMAKGGPRYVMEHFLPNVMGESTYRNLNPQLRERLLGNAEVLTRIEMPMFSSYVAEISKLRNSTVPLLITAGKNNANSSDPILRSGYEAAKWLADQLQVKLYELSGAHAPYLTDPEQFTRELQPLLRTF